jgi:hypothetical protein
MAHTTREEAIRACDFWLGLEYLNLVKTPDADEKRMAYSVLELGDMPWNNLKRLWSLKQTSARYKTQIAYCGLFTKRDFTVSLREMLKAEPLDPRELIRAGDASTLLIPLDHTGRVCGEVFISSLPWMMGRLQEHVTRARPPKDLDLTGFLEHQEELMGEVRKLQVQLQLVPEEQPAAVKEPAAKRRASPEDGAVIGMVLGDPAMRPLEPGDVAQMLEVIWKKSKWRPLWGSYLRPDVAGLSLPHLLRIKVLSMAVKDGRSKESKVDLKALNSLVANDANLVRMELSESRHVGLALQQYLKLMRSPELVDVRDRRSGGGFGHFVEELGLGHLPPGAWPDFPLVAAQQFAVNRSREHLDNGGLYGVNGPPGTGKSTLLRDVIADRMVAKAVTLASFDDPMSAFASRKGSIEGFEWGYYELDARLRGHGIVVASSNNGAVDNVVNAPTAKSEYDCDWGI